MASKKTKFELLIEANASGFTKNFGKVTSGLTAFDKQVKQSASYAKQLDMGLSGMAAKLGGLLGGFSAAAFATTVFDAGVAMDNLDKAFTSITGSSGAAEKELQYVKDLSEELGLEFAATADGYRLLLAAAQGTDLQGSGIQDFLRSAAEAAAATGATADEVKRAFAQVAQGVSRGKFELEDLKTIAEALPGVGFQDFADSLGVTTDKLFEMITAGEVMANEFIPGLTTALHDKFGEAAQEGAASAQAAINRFKNAWLDLRMAVADSGFMELAVGKMQELTAAMADPAVQAKVSDLASAFFAVAEAVAGFIVDHGKMLVVVGAGLVALSALARTVGLLHGVWMGLNAVMAQSTGMLLVPWLQSIGSTALAAVGGVTSLTAAFRGLALAAGGLFAGYKVGEWLTMRDAVYEINHAVGDGKEEFLAISKATGVAVTSMDELSQAVADGKIYFDDLTYTYKAGSGEIVTATKQAATIQKDATIQVTKEMQSAWQKYADKVKSLTDEIAGKQVSLNDRLREMSRSGMSDYDAWKDLKRQAKEYEQQAKLSAKAGNFDKALQYAQKAEDAYASLNKEVKDGEKVQVSARDALGYAMDGVESAGNLAISIMEKQKAAAQETADAMNFESGWQLGDAFTEAGVAAQDLAKAAGEIGKKWRSAFIGMKSDAMPQIAALDKALNAMAKDRTVTVTVKEVQAHATGGLIRKFARGGALGGYGGGDRIPAMLEAGEFVIRKEAVRKFGANAFAALNNLQLPEINFPRVGFATGGLAGGDTFNVNLALPGGGGTVALQGSGADSAQVLRDFTRSHRLRSA